MGDFQDMDSASGSANSSATESTNALQIFVEAETALSIKLPEVLINLLTVNGYTSEVLIATLTEEDIHNLEQFSRETLSTIVSTSDRKKYFGIFHEKPENFILVPGHKRALELLINYFKKKVSIKARKEREALPSEISTPRKRFKIVDQALGSASGTINQLPSQPQQQNSISLDLKEEYDNVHRIIFTWAQNRADRKLWENLKYQFDDIILEIQSAADNTISCMATCFCKASYKLVKIARNNQRKKQWNCSNFYVHLQKHINPKNLAKSSTSTRASTSTEQDLRQNLMTSYVTTVKKTFRHTLNSESISEPSSESDLEPYLKPTSRPTHSLKVNLKARQKANILDIKVIPPTVPSLAVPDTEKNILESIEDSTISTLRSESRSPYSYQNLDQDPSPSSSQYSAYQNKPQNEQKEMEIQDITDVMPLSQGSEQDPSKDNNEVVSSSLDSNSQNEPKIRQTTEKLSIDCEKIYSEISTEDTELLTTVVVKDTISSDIPEDIPPSFQPNENVCRKSKWRHEKYQRSQRKKRALERGSEDQTLITNYFFIAEKMHDLIKRDQTIGQHFLKACETYNSSTHSQTGSFMKISDSSIPNFLKSLLDLSLKNFTSKNNKKYDEAMKKFSIYLFYIGGRLLYETLYANLKNSLPSISTLNRYLDGSRSQMEEGVMDMLGLSTFLEKRNLPRVVWLSEDGTRVTGKIEYNARSNKVVGFVLPLSHGLPKTDQFIAIDAVTIENYFKTGKKANYAYVIMAQPLAVDAPSYCLCLYGTDNTFLSKDVLERWQRIRIEAQKFNITVAGFSSDGDSRLLRSMRISTNLPKQAKNSTENEEIAKAMDINLETTPDLTESLMEPTIEQTRKWDWFQSKNTTDEIYVQDTIHILTKLRTRILKPNITLPVGKYTASVDHLTSLVTDVSKDKHLLTLSDLKPEDKMNFLSAQKMCSEKTIECLKKVSGSEGTIAYLKLMRFILSTFLENNVNIETRLYRIWYVVFFLRVWRSWIKSNKSWTLKENFLSNNAYLCIELNAHALINLIIQLKIGKLSPEMFVILHFSSQPCESLFRAARSLTSTNSTVINFSIKELLHRINRIKAVTDIITDLHDIYAFPREEKRLKSKSNLTSVPTEKEIYDLDIQKTVERAREDVCVDLKILGISGEKGDYNFIDIPLKLSPNKSPSASETKDDPKDLIIYNKIPEGIEKNASEEANDDIEIDENQPLDQIYTKSTDSVDNVSALVFDLVVNEVPSEARVIDIDSSFSLPQSKCAEDLNMKDYSDQVEVSSLSEKSPFIKIELMDKTIIIRKSSFCWLLDESNGKVSTDRLRRFINSSKNSKKNVKTSDPTGVQIELQTRKENKKVRTKTIKANIETKKTEKKTPKRTKDTNDEDNLHDEIYFTRDSTEDSTETEEEYEVDDNSSDDIEDHDSDDSAMQNKETCKLILEKYYAIYYDIPETWFLGRLMEKHDSNSFKVKFLKSYHEKFVWPKNDDIQVVQETFIFYGPIDLVGSEPFQIKRHDLLQIRQNYKSMKSKIRGKIV